jgi:hypothetical protein
VPLPFWARAFTILGACLHHFERVPFTIFGNPLLPFRAKIIQSHPSLS